MPEIKFEGSVKEVRKDSQRFGIRKVPLGGVFKKIRRRSVLVSSCSKILETAQRKVEVLVKKEGAFELKAFEEEESEEK